MRGFEPICRAHHTSTDNDHVYAANGVLRGAKLLASRSGNRLRRRPRAEATLQCRAEAACPELSRSRLTRRVPVRAGRDVDPSQIPGPRASTGTLESHHLAGPISRGYGLCSADVGVPRARRAYRTPGRAVWLFVRPHALMVGDPLSGTHPLGPAHVPHHGPPFRRGRLVGREPRVTDLIRCDLI